MASAFRLLGKAVVSAEDLDETVRNGRLAALLARKRRQAPEP